MNKNELEIWVDTSIATIAYTCKLPPEYEQEINKQCKTSVLLADRIDIPQYMLK